MRNAVALIIFVFALISCEQKTVVNDDPVLVPLNVNEGGANQNLYSGIAMDYIKAIETTPVEDLSIKESLRFEKEGGFVEKATAYYLNDTLVKVQENYKNGHEGNGGVRVYYFDGEDDLIAVLHNYEDWSDPEIVVYTEKRSFYENGNPVQTQLRASDFYEDLENTPFEVVRNEQHDTKTVLNLVNETGLFQPHFGGVIKTNEEQLYLVLGEPNVDVGYFSAVMVNEKDDFIDDLLKNKEKYMNQPLHVDFYVTTGQVKTQIYQSGRWN